MKLSEASILSENALIHQLDNRGKVAESEILVPYWIGAAGLGKTQAVPALAKLLSTVRGVEFGCHIFSLAQYSPEDIAGLTIFLCSRAGSYTVGETITSDGGIVKTASHNLS